MMSSFVLLISLLAFGTLVTLGSGCNFLCGINAECVDDVCVCPNNKPLGDPKSYCYSNSESACYVTDDPIVNSFAGGKARLNFPCKYRLAQFDTPVQGGLRRKRFIPEEPFYPGGQRNNRCRVIVDATNALWLKGMYYVQSATVVISVKKKNQAEQVEIDLFAQSALVFFNGGFQIAGLDGNPITVTPRGSPVSVKRDLNTGQWLVSAPQCGTTNIAFRELDSTSERQRNRIGLSIVTQKNADFSDMKSKFPFALCDEPAPGGTPSVYHDFGREVSVQSNALATLFALLETTPLYLDEDDNRCNQAISAFQDCPVDKRADALKKCNPTLLQEFLGCTENDPENSLNAFKSCLTITCNPLADDRGTLCGAIYGKLDQRCFDLVVDACFQ